MAVLSALADIAVTIPTFDRSLVGCGNAYFQSTLINLCRGGICYSRRRGPIIVSDGSGTAYCESAHVMDALGLPGARHFPSAIRLSPCENAGRALSLAALTSAPWVLYLEDDIDVCDSFLDSVGEWLDDHADDVHRVYALGAAYTPQIEAEIARGSSAWEYPVHAFYGTQAIALRSEDARSLGEYWQASPKVRGVEAPGQYDLMLQDWLRHRYVDGRILAACPSFCAHVGRESSIRIGDPSPPVFESWRGRDWRYTSRSRVILSK